MLAKRLIARTGDYLVVTQPKTILTALVNKLILAGSILLVIGIVAVASLSWIFAGRSSGLCMACRTASVICSTRNTDYRNHCHCHGATTN